MRSSTFASLIVLSVGLATGSPISVDRAHNGIASTDASGSGSVYFDINSKRDHLPIPDLPTATLPTGTVPSSPIPSSAVPSTPGSNGTDSTPAEAEPKAYGSWATGGSKNTTTTAQPFTETSPSSEKESTPAKGTEGAKGIRTEDTNSVKPSPTHADDYAKTEELPVPSPSISLPTTVDQANEDPHHPTTPPDQTSPDIHGADGDETGDDDDEAHVYHGEKDEKLEIPTIPNTPSPDIPLPSQNPTSSLPKVEIPHIATPNNKSSEPEKGTSESDDSNQGKELDDSDQEKKD
ncbi:unnamed protein product [Somion occarium]|uniref:Uncharacterized protein n=1 Tax=Somion occarium TaxID=3059160 RepID=A0ABP1CPD5_9APHY